MTESKSVALPLGYTPMVEGGRFELPNPNQVIVKGIDKQQVGNLAADIRAIRKPEPYLGKGIKYTGEHIRRKQGKTGKK